MRADRSVAVGLEVGGSKTTVAIMGRQGHVRLLSETKTLRGRPPMATLEPYVRAIEGLLGQARSEGWSVEGIGVSLPGTLDYTRQRPLLIPSILALNGFPLYE